MNASVAVGPAPPAAGSRRDWRVWLGLGLTALWLSLGLRYVDRVIGWDRFAAQPADALGSFLEGAFAPLAFLWLVIGFFLQQKELAGNNEAIRLQYLEMRRSAEQAEIQARAIAASELHQRQETLLLVWTLVRQQLGSISGLLFVSSQGGSAGAEELTQYWQRFGAGDAETFSRALVQLHFTREGPSWELFWSTPVRKRHSENFVTAFERMLAATAGCDPEGILAGGMRGSSHGFLYTIMRQQREDPPPGAQEPARDDQPATSPER
jgi:hypothetical protein